MEKHWYEFSDGFFTFFVCKETGERKLTLDKGDILVEPNLDDFM